MTTKRTLTLACIAVCLSIFSLISCKKDAKSNADTDVVSAEDNSMAESNYNDVTTMVDLSYAAGSNMSFRGETGENLLGSSCVTVTVDTASSPRQITIDFGSTNCLCLDGRNRRGQIIATWTGKYRDSGTVISVTFNNYFVNDNQIKGTKTVTNKGFNAQEHLVYAVQVNGTIIKANNGGTITWNSTRQREWIAGFDTPLNIADDTYSITGNANGVTAAGLAYTIEITTPLVRKMTCRWFESGVITLTPEGHLARTLDYGNTGCDANATVTIAGITFPIILQ